MRSDATSPEREKVHDAIASLAPELVDGVNGPMLTEWVLITAWVDQDGEPYTARMDAPQMRVHHRFGLLHDALYEDWEKTD